MTNIRINQSGLVSITVTVILMLVISITVMSFAQIIRREQRQALDTQLNSQAFYAAESGINATREYIKGMNPVPNKKTCDWNGFESLQAKRIINAQSKTEFTCILLGGTPSNLVYELSTTSPSKVFPIDAGASIIDSLEIKWAASTDSSPMAGCPTVASATLTRASTWPCNGYGMLRLDVVPFNASGQTRSSLTANTFTAFLTPTTSTSPASISFYKQDGSLNIHGANANQGALAGASCDALECKITITGMAGQKYYARIMALYRDTRLTVTAKDIGGADLPLQGAQIMIDATGRSQDVLRRIQVRIPLIDDAMHADYAIQAVDSLCKQFTSFPGNNLTTCP